MPTMTSNGAKTEPIALRPMEQRTIEIPIVGETPLIVHAWSVKAKAEYVEQQTKGKTRTKKPLKVPEDDFRGAMYLLPDRRHGFPSSAFKAAIVSGARFFDGVTMASLRSAIRVIGEGPEQLIPIIGPEPTMREDIVRNESGVIDIRYRPQYWPWSMTLTVVYSPTQITLDSLIHLVNAGGQGGVGEWRPNSKKSLNGTFGIFSVVNDGIDR